MIDKKYIHTTYIFVFYLCISTLFTWPAARFAEPLFPTRQFDIYPVIWLVEEGPSIFPSLMHTTSAWPYGEVLVRIDSYVLLYLSWINNNFFSGYTVASLLLWLGPVVNAMAAEWCASRGMGIARPWSILSGLYFAFSSIVACAILEGHLYYLLDPWLPLLLKTLWESSGGKTGWKQGILAGVWFTLSLFTSAYMGICAVLLVGWVGLRAPRWMWKVIAQMMFVVLPAVGYYIFLFRSGGTWESGTVLDLSQNLKGGTSTLFGLLSWGEPADSGWHSIVSPLAFSMFWAIGLTFFLRGARFQWLAIGATLLLLLSFGASFQLWPKGPAVPGPLQWLAFLPGVSFFRFPIRLLWLFNLLGGIVGAEFFWQLSQGISKKSLFFVLTLCIALGDTFGMTGMPARMKLRWLSIPSAYTFAPKDAAVLDLMGEMVGPARVELAMRRRVLGCFYQTAHHRPVLDVCIGTSGTSPRDIVSSWLMPNLFDPKNPREIAQRIRTLGIGSIALHRDTFRALDAQALHEGLLVVFGPPIAQSEDGGAVVELYQISNYERDKRAMLQAFRGYGKVP